MRKNEMTLSNKQLGMFLGCPVLFRGKEYGVLNSISLKGNVSLGIEGRNVYLRGDGKGFQLVLRTMNQLSFEERVTLSRMDTVSLQSSAEVIYYLTSKGIDVFNWIPQGLALKETRAYDTTQLWQQTTAE